MRCASHGLQRIFHSKCCQRASLAFFSNDTRASTSVEQGRASTHFSKSLSSSSSSCDSSIMSPAPSGHQLSIDNSSTVRSNEDKTKGPRQRTDSSGASVKYKTSRKPLPTIKVKKRSPWGMQQLRDSWSADAMTKSERENMSERIHREYRYHPEEFRRHNIKLAAFMTLPAILVGAFGGYYYHTGRPLWEGDPQYLLNMIRQMDTSPRSKLSPYTLEGTEELPAHVRAYREKNWERRLALEGAILGQVEKEQQLGVV
ncbi:hypothetical protein MOQ_009379 [Trypanosoma cruzi marinkellei]|uniref:Transmembrane protein n=1 Tax=Trypanosoma cruzi marinkellei TaxID=85056 RepID=K2MX19_TRYCR|nr:hypothetical protein MOQ_009379 [Trypanosoma cruzi marinkellei]